ncbi:hypothetical protein [Allorhizobium borbori]|uniref:Uncharacterized protein n=1 Tax=Allorhizobium borbori TaxID=485907 RepID=A0A7W6P067_9HYPH|nr:hypothetical protein [Allorhizobium borbori]MBB4103009.1 hypothetical protein [Allorhizobium borbori]
MFSEVIKANARGHVVHCAVLLEMQFLSGTMYVHNGGGVLYSRSAAGALEGIKWLGLQGMATVSGLGASRIGASRQVSCALVADDATIREYFFEEEQRQIKGRKFRFWGQFYEGLRPLDSRFHIYTGIGDRLRMVKEGATSRKITLLLEDRFSRRRRSANLMVTHSDQQTRDPGNTGFIYVQKMVDQTLNLYDARN